MIGKGRWLFISIGLAITILVVTGSSLQAAEKPPIKVGLLLPYTGTMPFQTKGVNDGVELYFGELGMKAGGGQYRSLRRMTRITRPRGSPKCGV